MSLRVLHEGSDRLFVRCTVAAAERAGRATGADAIAPHSACSIVREARRTPLSPKLAIVNDLLAVALAAKRLLYPLSRCRVLFVHHEKDEMLRNKVISSLAGHNNKSKSNLKNLCDRVDNADVRAFRALNLITHNHENITSMKASSSTRPLFPSTSVPPFPVAEERPDRRRGRGRARVRGGHEPTHHTDKI